MPSDPQDKAERPDSNVAALHRAEFETSIEKKLSEARRFFSLHDYASCEELVQEVLAADPQNSKAKVLLDLSSIKLSKRRLYKKIAEPQPPASLPSGPALVPDSQPALETSRAQPDPLPSPPTSSSIVIEEPPRRRSRSLPKSAAKVPQDSIREKTISALVDLLKNKETTLQDWQGDRQASTASPRPLLSPPPPEAEMPVTVEGPPSSFASVQPSQPASHQALPTTPAQSRPSALKADRDFLPGSLDELFEAEPAKSLPPPHVEPRPPVAPTSVTPQKNVPTPAALSSPPERSTETTKAPQATFPVARIATSQQPEVSFQPPPLAPQPPALMKEAAKKPLDSSPVTPPVAPPPAPPAKPTSPPTPSIIQLPGIHIFDQVTAPSLLGYQKQVELKIEQRSDELKNSETQAGAIAQIKKYLYQEEYDLCARDLAKIRDLFPQNPEIQAFVENTSKRLVELQRIKKFEVKARDLMASAVAFYQKGKREEALIAVREILRVNPNHVQAREFVSFVERHQGKSRKQPSIQKVRACRSCGSEVDAVSQFCYHCGKRL